VFAHAGTNGVLLCHLLGLDPVPWEWTRFVTARFHHPAGIDQTRRRHTFSLTKLSDVEHLAVGDRTG
jgi:broad specificity phosphatase PhoE